MLYDELMRKHKTDEDDDEIIRIIEELDVKIEEVKKDVEKEEWLFTGIIRHIKELAPCMTSEIVFQNENGGEIRLKTNEVAKNWEKYLDKEIEIKATKKAGDEIFRIDKVSNICFRNELKTFFYSEDDIKKYQKMLDSLPKEKLEYLRREHKKRKSLNVAEESGRERFTTVQELFLKYAVLRSTYPPNIAAEIERDIAEYEKSNSSGEKTVLKKVLDILINYPYHESPSFKTVDSVRKEMEEYHVGQCENKDFLMREYEAFSKSEGRKAPKCVVLSGPPGCGKTNLVTSLAQATGLPFSSYNLSGVKDQVVMVGSSRVYENSSLGEVSARILSIGKTGIMLFENVDKIENEQCMNSLLKMLEGYLLNDLLEVPFDINGIWIVCTTTDTSKLSASVLDKVTVLNMASYTEEETLEIAKKMYDSICEERGLDEKQVEMEEDVLYQLAIRYGTKNNLRSVKENLEDVLKNVVGDKEGLVTLAEDNLSQYFTLLKNAKQIRETYARETMALKKKALLCQDEYTPEVKNRIFQLFDEYDRSEEDKRAYPKEALTELVNTLPRKITLDIEAVERELRKELYGLDEVINEILDQLVASQCMEEFRFTPLLLDGAAGVGKTSLARALSRALSMAFVEKHCNEITCPEQLSGYSRTMKDGQSGLFHQLSEEGVESCTAVVLWDEWDKVAQSRSGDIYGVFYNLFDERGEFWDNRIEVHYDTRQLWHIATTNEVMNIPPTLRDRCKIISVSGYSMREKEEILRDYVLPKFLEKYKLTDKVVFSEESLSYLVKNYALSPGVRDLEHCVDGIILKLLRKYLRQFQTNESFVYHVEERDIRERLGSPILGYDRFPVTGHETYGVARALAVSGHMGCTFGVECKNNLSKKAPKIEVTGMAKDSCFESVKDAAHLVELMLGREIGNKLVHFSDGGVQKSGPSAGVAIWAAIMSNELKRSLPNVAMTGEILLCGEIHSIGGVKEKISAAERAKVETVYIPYENYVELQDKQELKHFDIEVVPVKTVYELAGYLFPEEVFVKAG